MIAPLPSPNSPCNGCERRHTGCHATCEAYLEFAANRQKALAERYRTQKILYSAVVPFNRRRK